MGRVGAGGSDLALEHNKAGERFFAPAFAYRYG